MVAAAPSLTPSLHHTFTSRGPGRKPPLIHMMLGLEIAVLHANPPTFCFNAFVHIFQQDRCKISLLHAYTMIPHIRFTAVQDFTCAGIDTTGLLYTAGMQVSVDVGAKATLAGFMHRNVTQDHSVQHMIRPQLTKILTVFCVAEDVVVATDQHLITVQTMQCRQCLAVDNHIAQVIHLV